MIGIDRRVARAILDLSGKSYSAELQYDPSQKTLFLMEDMLTVFNSKRIDLDPDEVNLSIQRLIDKGFLRKTSVFWGGFRFSITPELRHRFAFWLDTFTKKFWGGFLTGVVAGLTANLLTGYARTAISAAIQWLQSRL